jgi:hypothetical protein
LYQLAGQTKRILRRSLAIRKIYLENKLPRSKLRGIKRKKHCLGAKQALGNRTLQGIEEPEVNRTQELVLALSHDGGQTYQTLLRQEYNFSPPGTTFEREEWTVMAEGVTHLQLVITPEKGGKSHRATLTSLALQ